ncbi:ATP-binding protein [Leucobacter ruminantium]|uniref:PspC domain-containing protein n=1 Tax=Leucobacter ruminantium TaxID=1289170 RepID=A0A939LW41_9MICO|nr:ATP-binding protein [Leucobacter ruminantium]MBO1805511.1 PspC domain-containing protein [Leucobacter ruminantium]
MERPPLTRPLEDRILAGVCAGLARHLGLPVGAVRIGTLVFAALGGFGALLYLWLWATVPREGETEGVVPLRRALTRPADAGEGSRPPGAAPTEGAPWAAPAAGSAGAAVTDRRSSEPGERGGADADHREGSGEASRGRWPIAELLLGACLLIAGAGLVLERLGVHINLELVLPALAVLVGVGLTWWQIADRDRPDRHQLPRVLGALALVAVGVLMFFVTAREPSALTVIAAALAVLGGVALAIAPWLLRLNRELLAERSARAREAERSDIAAHLHDSVLQTLALIQQRSDPGSEVARLARGQERELREWLFRAADGGAPQREAVGTELREHAAALEEAHPVRFEVIGVGLGDSATAPSPIVAAAREAMLNAARHAGGDVTVYVEASRHRISVDVTDRGPGLDLGALPEGRMGVRESILGRMERAGGTARFVPGPGGAGTSVRLSMPLEEPGSVPEPASGPASTSVQVPASGPASESNRAQERAPEQNGSRG